MTPSKLSQKADPSPGPKLNPAGGDRFRRLALTLPGAVEGAHMGHPDFRVNGRIFATLAYESRGQGTLMLTPEQQQAFIQELPGLFEPVPGGWGRAGATLLRLSPADDATLYGALSTAHQNILRKASAAKRGRKTSTTPLSRSAP